MSKTATKTSLTYKIGGEHEVNRMGYGGMQLTGSGVWGDPADRENAKNVLKAAVAAGVNFIDTADSYGPHTNEILIQESIGEHYDKVLIATKGGFERPAAGQWVPNGHPDYIKKCIEGSLKRLKTERIELWQLHRIDPAVPVEDTLAPVAAAVAAGKIRYVGLSEVDIKGIERAQKVVPIISVQNLYNLGNRKWESVLDYSAQKQIAFIPWYPLASGPSKMQGKIGEIAKAHNATLAEVALAWLLKRSPNILLIPGTSSLQHLKENLQAVKVELTDEEFESLSK